jgi:2-polyprenyl-3-methyl-5-hydroxy-6-metoxy-1,4-benzoquinol methylase
VYIDRFPQDLTAAYPPDYEQHRAPPLPRIPRQDAAASFRTRLHGTMLARYGYQGLATSPAAKWAARIAATSPHLRLRSTYGFVLLPRWVPNGRLLDVGCGNGRFLRTMAELGWEVEGIEPDVRTAEIARAHTRSPIHARLEDAGFAAETFDVIVMNHVLEHVPDPRTVLEECHRIIRTGGVLGLALPNPQALGHRVFGSHWSALEPPRHLVFFSPEKLADLVRVAGFSIARVRTTSARNAEPALRDSFRYRYGRPVPRFAMPAWRLAAALSVLITGRTGEEIVLWARKP